MPKIRHLFFQGEIRFKNTMSNRTKVDSAPSGMPNPSGVLSGCSRDHLNARRPLPHFPGPSWRKGRVVG